jgi:hypothetical protein
VSISFELVVAADTCTGPVGMKMGDEITNVVIIYVIATLFVGVDSLAVFLNLDSA